MTPDEALCYLLDRNMSKDDYLSIRYEMKAREANVFPAYEHVRAAKAKYRPSKEEMKFSDTIAEVSL